MTRATWPHVRNRPAVEISLVDPLSNQSSNRVLLGDSGAGSGIAPFELILTEDDCLLFAADDGELVHLSGAYSGEFRTYAIRIELPALWFSESVTVIGVDRAPVRFDGIAGFRFLNRFSFGNFGSSDSFGLELLP